ncbi:MAG: biotin--[acetyl-CoA-carboxylase] ligase [Planctomycetota bacterium]|jgi:BirA family biotin operon repressor/biotin-[acetyl-CoA-carboxylase] ligase
MAAMTDEALEAVLNLFRNNPDGFRPATIAERTGFDVEFLADIRARLVEDGFTFSEDEEGRWVLQDKPDLLYPYWVRAGLRCDRLAQQVYFKEEVDSTQNVAFELLVEGRPHGTLVLAEHQTKGRGREEAHWHDDPGKSLLFSLLLDLEPPETFASVLTIATATALARAIQDVAGLPARIVFPNDILVRGKKVAGILLEVKDYGVPTRRAVVGIGLNVMQEPDDFPEELRDIATSLAIEARDPAPIKRTRLLRLMLRELERWLDHISHGDYEDLEAAWNRFAAMEGREVRVRVGGEVVVGRVLDARIREGLSLRLETGEERRVRLEHLTDFEFADSPDA